MRKIVVTAWCFLLAAVLLAAGGNWSEASAQLKPVVLPSARSDVSPRLADLEPVQPDAAAGERELPLGRLPKTGREAGAPDELLDQFDPVVQSAPGFPAMPAPLQNFEGLNNTYGVYPPDPNGDAGPNHYFQTVNLGFQIFNKTGTSLYGPALNNTLFSGFGGPCQTDNDGDPIVLYDHLADRWFFTQFAIDTNFGTGPYYQCVAVSTSPDPLGTWYRYAFPWPGNKLNDYTKVGVWPDGYYLTTNQFTPDLTAWDGAGVAVLERSQMIAGGAARIVYFDLEAVDSCFGGMLPSDLDGTAPPAGTPAYFAEVDDGSWACGGSNDTLKVWEFHTDWVTPANSTFGLAGLPTTTLDVAGFNPLCTGTRQCIPQPGTSVKLDAIGDRLMYRLQYRTFDTHASLVANHTVDAGSGRAGVRWYELRKRDSDPWAIQQQGTYAPADTENRWMGSVAMDARGNVAVGYSVASAAVYPSIRYAGRLAGDPDGTLAQGEAAVVDGTGSQTGSASRWGDYSMMGVDPDGCTFWYTTEYVQTTGAVTWRTRISSFQLPGCTAATSGVLQGTVTDSTDGSPLAGARVAATGGFETLTDASGIYRFASLPAGSYTVTASLFGFTSQTASGVLITDGGTTTQNFSLNPAPLVTVQGTVTDGSGHGWPLYATIAAAVAGGPTATASTEPATGAYSIQLYQDVSYTFTVGAPGYQSAVRTVTPPGGGSTENFVLTVAAACTAPGYAPLFSEGFEGATPPALPAGWAKVDINLTGGDWLTNTGTLHPSGAAAHGGTKLVLFNSYTSSSGSSTRLYRTTGLDLSALVSVSMAYWMYHDTGYSGAADRVQVQVSTDGGTVWANAGAAVNRYDGSTGWKQHTVDLSAFAGAGKTDVRIALLGISVYGNDVHVDDVSVGSCAPVAGGLIAGRVRDANTGATLEGAAVTNDTAVSTDSDDAGVYVLFSPVGTHTVTASKASYTDDAGVVGVVADAVTTRDFNLTAPRLAATPTAYSVTISSSGPLTVHKSLVLQNTGSAGATFTIAQGAGAPVLPVRPPAPGSPEPAATPSRAVQLALAGASPAVAAGPSPLSSINFVLDDGSAEDSVGLTAGGQFLWFNRFTPAPTDFPFLLSEISVIFMNTVAVGDAMELVVWEDTDGDGNPATGANLLGTQNVNVLYNDGATWNVYTLASPLVLNGPNDVLVGLVNRSGASGYGDYPAAIDKTSSQVRSWVGAYSGGSPADPPVLPADAIWGTIDSVGIPGNWMIRAGGEPYGRWVTPTPASGAIAAGGSQVVDLLFDATRKRFGRYTATLLVQNNSPYGTLSVPVEMAFIKGKLMLFTPNGGERLAAGAFTTIRWGALAGAAKFTLSYSVTGGRTWKTIAKNVTGTSRSWRVPRFNADKQCLVQIVSYTAGGAKIATDRSDQPFTIEVVKLTAPNGGERFLAREKKQITWRTNATLKPVASATLSYSVNGGARWKTIKKLSGNPGSYQWTVPALPMTSSKCLVSVVLKDAAGRTLGSDKSDSAFTISPYIWRPE